MAISLMLAAALAAAGLGTPTAPPPDVSATAESHTDAAIPTPVPTAKLVLPKGTMVRLMVTKEVNSRDNRPGDRFVLRVDEDVRVGGVTVIPTGARGWGEVVDLNRSAGVGKSGRISARLLYLEVNGERIDLDGESQSRGSGGTGQTVAGLIAFGPLGLLMKGNNATLKAGEILNGYTLADANFDRAAEAQ
jgi:hypothetical protein